MHTAHGKVRIKVFGYDSQSKRAVLLETIHKRPMEREKTARTIHGRAVHVFHFAGMKIEAFYMNKKHGWVCIGRSITTGGE